jgi:hypothetical protein
VRRHLGRRIVTLPEWLRWYMRTENLAPAPKRGADSPHDTYARAQRTRSIARKRRGPGYAKLTRRVERAFLAGLHGHASRAQVQLMHTNVLKLPTFK